MNLREQLLSKAQGNVVVVGIGNPCRGDDAAGSQVACGITARPGVHVIDAQDVPEDYLCQIEARQPDTVMLIDSVDLGSAPGSVALLDKDRTTGYYPSTHRVPVQLLVNYLERTTRARILLLAIQPRQTGFLQAMSAEVSSSVEAITDVLNDVLRTRSASANVDFASSQKGVVPA
jgi:hydrogenase 3 maturation protease